MQQCGAINALEAASDTTCLIRRGKRAAFFFIGPRRSRPLFLKKKSIKCICPIRRGKIPSFYPLIHVVSTDGPEKESIKCFLSY